MNIICCATTSVGVSRVVCRVEQGIKTHAVILPRA
jgi:hypothetical protein